MTTQTQETKYFDLHVHGIGYVNRIREVPVKRGNPFWACDIAALHGAEDDVEFTRFDCRVSATSRRKKSTHGDSDDAYLFISCHGNPYYQDTSETRRFDDTRTKRYEANGGAIRVFIADRVLPEMRKKLSKHFHYQFHDLRASFGMNLTDSQLKLVEKGERTLHETREFVKTRMCHASTVTTDSYLQYRKKNKIVKQIQRSYEDHLRNLTETAINGLPHENMVT